jgi:hypothetical protein
LLDHCRSTRSLPSAGVRPMRVTTWHGCIRAISRCGARWASSCGDSRRRAFPTP